MIFYYDVRMCFRRWTPTTFIEWLFFNGTIFRVAGQFGYILTSKTSFRCSQWKSKDDLFTDMKKHVVKDQQEKEKGERAPKRKSGKTYRVTSLGETDYGFCLKVTEEGNSFVTKSLSSSSVYLPSVVD